MSTMPPRKPASRPMVVPMMMALTLATMPTISEIRAPYTVRTKTSRPRSSVPNQYVELGGAGQPVAGQPVVKFCWSTPWPTR